MSIHEIYIIIQIAVAITFGIVIQKGYMMKRIGEDMLSSSVPPEIKRQARKNIETGTNLMLFGFLGMLGVSAFLFFIYCTIIGGIII